MGGQGQGQRWAEEGCRVAETRFKLPAEKNRLQSLSARLRDDALAGSGPAEWAGLGLENRKQARNRRGVGKYCTFAADGIGPHSWVTGSMRRRGLRFEM